MGLPIRRMFVVSVSLYFIYMGVCTVTPILNSGLHSELSSSFSGHAKVFPGRFGVHLDPELYRFIFGLIEIVAGALIIIGESVWAVYSVWALLTMQAFLCLSLYSQGESTKCIPNLVALNLIGVLAGGSHGQHHKID
ncbi:uncharacterized protein LOC134813011 [Bolinopsis microptera]|uniref:uncharacterized protein LOC134813011 n=1 Tax=Bolinopsis microptera TaxID=2820187 RepID=UPI00307A2916